MAERRMFSKTIIDSDAFLDMPLSTQALYFHLSMRADDEGFINNAKKIQRMIGCNDDDLKILLAKKFIINFETGIVVIKHWKIHNYIRGDRLQDTNYKKERSQLSVKDNGSYTLVTVESNCNNNQQVTEVDDDCQSGDSQMSGKCQECDRDTSATRHKSDYNSAVNDSKHSHTNAGDESAFCDDGSYFESKNSEVNQEVNVMSDKCQTSVRQVSDKCQDRLGKVRLGKVNIYTSNFDKFWSAYPKKVGKDAALKSWKKCNPAIDDVLHALEWQKDSEQWLKGFIPNPTTYLNQGRWKDEKPSDVELNPF